MARAKAAPDPVTPERLHQVLGSYRYSFANERDLQDGIAQALSLRGIRFDRNVQIAPKGALAAFVVEGIAVAVVLDGSPAEVLGELARCPRTTAVVLVTRRGPVPPSFPAKVGRKPLYVVTVGGAV